MNRFVMTLSLLAPFFSTDANAGVYAEVHFSSLSNMCTVTDSEWGGDPELVLRYGAYNDWGAGRIVADCDGDVPWCLWYDNEQGDYARQQILSVGEGIHNYECILGPDSDRCDGNTYQSIDDSFIIPIKDRSSDFYYSMQLVDRDVWHSDNLGSHMERVSLAPAGSYTGIHPLSRWNNNNHTFDTERICEDDYIEHDGASGNYRIHAWSRVYDTTAGDGWVAPSLEEVDESLTLDFQAWDENSGISRVGYVFGHWDPDTDVFLVDIEGEIPVGRDDNSSNGYYSAEVTFCTPDAVGVECDHTFQPVRHAMYSTWTWAENGGMIELDNVSRTLLGYTWGPWMQWGPEIPPQLDPSEMPHWLDGLAIGDSIPAEPVLIPLEDNRPYDLAIDAGDAQAEPGETQELVIEVTDAFGFLTAVDNDVEITLGGRATVVSTDLVAPAGVGTGFVTGVLPPEGLARFEITHARPGDIDVYVRVKGTFDASTTVTFGPRADRGEDPQSTLDRDSEPASDGGLSAGR